MLTADEVLDKYFPEVRAWLIQTAAVMDRIDRAAARGEPISPEDQRLKEYYASLKVLSEQSGEPNRAEQIQRIFSDPVD